MATIIYPSPIDFNWMYQRPQQLLHQMSLLGYYCIFINSPVFINQENEVQKVNNNFIVVNNSYKIEYKYLSRPIILYQTYPPSHKLNINIPHDISIFDCLDYPDEEFKHWKENYSEICSYSDIILCSSYELYEYQKENWHKAHIIRNGTDFAFFKRGEKKFNKLIKNICFIGSIAPWVDFDLIEYVADRNKDKEFILIGSFYDGKSIPSYKNIHYLGRKSYSVLPEYMAQMDMFILPFKVNKMTNCVSPIKLFEYLSTGKPVVSTPIREVLPLDRGYVYVGRTYEKFNSLINLAFREKNKKAPRQVYAYFNSWKFKGKHLNETIKNYIKNSWIK